MADIAYINGSSGHYDVWDGATNINVVAFSVTTGNCIVVGTFSVDEFAGSVTDTAGNIYTSIGTFDNGGYGKLTLWMANNIIGNASNVITAHYVSSPDYPRVVAIQLTNVDSYNSGFTPAGNYDSSSPATSNSGTTTIDAEWLIGFFESPNNGPWATSGDSIVRYTDNNSWSDTCIATREIATAGSGKYIEIGSSADASILVRAIKPATGGGSNNGSFSANIIPSSSVAGNYTSPPTYNGGLNATIAVSTTNASGMHIIGAELGSQISIVLNVNGKYSIYGDMEAAAEISSTIVGEFNIGGNIGATIDVIADFDGKYLISAALASEINFELASNGLYVVNGTISATPDIYGDFDAVYIGPVIGELISDIDVTSSFSGSYDGPETYTGDIYIQVLILLELLVEYTVNQQCILVI